MNGFLIGGCVLLNDVVERTHFTGFYSIVTKTPVEINQILT